jgi:hypothetical protein
MYRGRVRSYGGTTGNELDLMWALPGDTDGTILGVCAGFPGEGRWPNWHNTIWRTVFETDRTSAPGVESYVLGSYRP